MSKRLERERANLWSRLRTALAAPAARQEAFDAMAQRVARKLHGSLARTAVVALWSSQKQVADREKRLQRCS